MIVRLTASHPPQLPDSRACDHVRVTPAIGNALVAAGCAVVLEYDSPTSDPPESCRVDRPGGWSDEDVDRALGRESKETE